MTAKELIHELSAMPDLEKEVCIVTHDGDVAVESVNQDMLKHGFRVSIEADDVLYSRFDLEEAKAEREEH